MANGLAVLILMLSALSAILAGMAVFANSRPPDIRFGQMMEDLDELKSLVNQLQKSVLQMERKMEKDQRDIRTEFKETLEKGLEKVERKLHELA